MLLNIGTRQSLFWVQKKSTASQVLPVFLCPVLSTNVVVPSKVKPRRREISSTPYSMASSSKCAAPAHLNTSILSSTSTAQQSSSLAIRNTGLEADPFSLKNRKANNSREELYLIHEALDDLLSRANDFNSLSETTILLEEAKRQISKNCSTTNHGLFQLVQVIAAKTSFGYVQLGQSRIALAILSEVTSNWTLEAENEFRNLWKPVISITYSRQEFSEAAQLTELLLKESVVSGDWMNLARLQILLRMAEKGQWNSRVMEVDSLWKVFDRKRLEIPRSAMILILESQVKRGNVVKIKKTLEAMAQRSFRLTLDIWETLRDPLIRCHNGKEIVPLLFEYSVKKAPLHIVNNYLRYFTKLKDVRSCIKVMRLFGIPTGAQKSRTVLVKPTSKVYHRLIRMFSRMSQPENAIRFLSLALKQNCKGDHTISFVEIAYALNAVQRAEEAIGIGAKLTNSPLQHQFKSQLCDQLPNSDSVLMPSRRVYSILLSSVALLRNVEDIAPTARTILLEMFRLDKVVNEGIRRALARIVVRLSRYANLSHLTSLFAALNSLTHINSTDNTSMPEAKLFANTLKREGIEDLFSISAWKHYTPKEKETYSRIVKVVSDVPFQTGVNLEDFFPKYGEITMSGYISLLDFDEMDLDRPLSPAAYAMRIRVYGVIRRDYRAAQTIYRAMHFHNVKATLHHVAPMIESLVYCNRIDLAEEVKAKASKGYLGEDVKDRKISINRIYGALCRGYARLEDWKAICDLAEEMQDKEILIDQSFQRGFAKAQRMLRIQSKSKEGGEIEMEKSLKLGEIQSLKSLWKKENLPWTVESITWTFQDLHQSKQYLSAHEIVAAALQDGLKSDRLLRRVLAKSENWLKKEIRLIEERTGNPRTLLSRQRALALCIDNQIKTQADPKEVQEALLESQRELKARRSLLSLLHDTFATRRLWDEAHQQ